MTDSTATPGAAPDDDPALAAAKRAARAAALAARPPTDPMRDAALRAVLLPLVAGHAAVAAVWPLPGEADLRPLLARLHADGTVVLLPETPPRGRPLRFRRWMPGATMLPGRFGTLHPDGPEAMPDLLLVPLLLFDGRGVRLGYGGGYYDRTLARLPGVPAIGFAHARQEVASLPAGPNDVRLAAVATERGVRRFG